MADAPATPGNTTPDDDPLVRTVVDGGRRRLIYAILALVAVVAVVAAAVAGPGGEATDDPELATGNDIGALLTVQAATLSGLLPADALSRAQCTPAELGVYACDVDAANVAGVPRASRRGELAVIEFEIIDGAVVKHFAALDAAPENADAAARAIASDDRTVLGLSTSWRCAFSVGIQPDGSRADDSPGGYRCVQTEGPAAGGDRATQRYVEFRDDGHVAKDFVISRGSPGAAAELGPGS